MWLQLTKIIITWNKVFLIIDNAYFISPCVICTSNLLSSRFIVCCVRYFWLHSYADFFKISCFNKLNSIIRHQKEPHFNGSVLTRCFSVELLRNMIELGSINNKSEFSCVWHVSLSADRLNIWAITISSWLIYIYIYIYNIYIHTHIYTYIYWYSASHDDVAQLIYLAYSISHPMQTWSYCKIAVKLLTAHRLQRGRLSTIYAISVLRNDKICKCIPWFLKWI